MKALEKPNGFKFVRKCKICSGKTREGKEIRPIVEMMVGQGKKQSEVLAYLLTEGISFNQPNLSGHFRKHAPYVTKGTVLSPESIKAVTTLTHSSENAKKALNNIIAMGGQMIENWWKRQHGEQVSGPEMPITGKILIEALKEEGKRAPKTALDSDFESLTQKAIEGEVVNESNPTS